jgi:hypothetical protein
MNPSIISMIISIQTHAIDAVSLYYEDKPIGRIPLAGAESLCKPHVHESLIDCFRVELLKVLNSEINKINCNRDKLKVCATHALVILNALNLCPYQNKKRINC